MKADVQTFFQTLNDRQHIFQLIRQTRLNIVLLHNGNQASLLIKDGLVHLDQEDPLSKTIEITGDIPLLLSGKGTLRELASIGKIQINAPFRTLLLLESIFYLGKQSPQLQKII